MKMTEYIINSEFTIENKLNYQSVIELLCDRLNTDSHHNCFIDCTLERKWSKKQVLDSSLNFAYYLINDCKISKGNVICFITNSSDIQAIGFIGSLAAGMVFCCLAEHSSQDEIKSNIEKLKPSVVKLLISDKQSKPDANGNTLQSLEEIFCEPRDDNLVLPVKSGLDETATYVLSSGSTGQPKAIIKTNRNLLTTVEALQHPEMTELTPNEIQLSSNFSHVSGQRYLISAINGGAQLAIVRVDENLDDVYGNIHKYNITSAFLIPTQLNYLVKNSETIDRDYFKSLRDVVTGAAPVPETTFRCVVDKFKFKKFRICYGMSEVGWTTQTPVTQFIDDYTCVGKMCPNTQIKVIDDQGHSLPANTRGQICIGGPQVTPGYLNNAEENDKLFTADGFLKTGDIGYYDDNHYFYIV
ncbi:unnamed protein product, partial [Oppiella nova]